MRIYTITNTVLEGTITHLETSKDGDFSYWVVTVGEYGRGRQKGIITCSDRLIEKSLVVEKEKEKVQLKEEFAFLEKRIKEESALYLQAIFPKEDGEVAVFAKIYDTECSNIDGIGKAWSFERDVWFFQKYKEELWQKGIKHIEEKKRTEVHIYNASIGETRKGNKKLILEKEEITDAIILVLHTSMEFRGSNSHKLETQEDGNEKLISIPENQILCQGNTAQGTAGRMGSATQMVLVLGKEQVLNIELFGRMYGSPSSFYCQWNGKKLVHVTAEERDNLDLF